MRARAGLPAITVTSAIDVANALQKERLFELCFEGKRWYDLLRTGMIKDVRPTFLTVCDGRDLRQYGWGRFSVKMEDFIFNSVEMGTLANGQLQPQGKVTTLRIYNRPLMNTEGIGNHNNFTKK